MESEALLNGTPEGSRPAESQTASSCLCPEHNDRPAELFCRRCRLCVCALCPVLGAHRGHPVSLASEEAAHVQKVTQECLKQLETKKQQQEDKKIQTEDVAEQLKAHAEASKTWLTGKFTELRLLLEEEEVLAKKLIDKNTQLALQAYGEQIKSCEDQIDALNSLSYRVWSISQETRPVQLLQDFTAAEQEMKKHMSLGEQRHPVPQSFEPIKTFFKGLVEAMQNMMQMPLEVRLKEKALGWAVQGSWACPSPPFFVHVHVLPLLRSCSASRSHCSALARQLLLGFCFTSALPAPGSPRNGLLLLFFLCRVKSHRPCGPAQPCSPGSFPRQLGLTLSPTSTPPPFLSRAVPSPAWECS